MKKNYSEKVSPPFLKRLTPIPYVHTFTLLFIIYWIPPLGKANGIHPPPPLKKRMQVRTMRMSLTTWGQQKVH